MPGPDCLEKERQKPNGDYKCGNVLKLLKDDFNNKCYLCEEKAPSSIEVDHFEPHRGRDKDKEFDWKNLFFSCRHCNKTKGVKYNTDTTNRILNCTNPDHDVEGKIIFEVEFLNADSQAGVVIKSMSDEPLVKNTVKLLNEVYNGTTKNQQIESENIRGKLIEDVDRFQECLRKFHNTVNEKVKRYKKKEIDRHLLTSSAFTAFKRRIWMNEYSVNTEKKEVC